MSSAPIYENLLDDGRMLSVIEAETARFVYREVLIVQFAPDDTDPVTHPDLISQIPCLVPHGVEKAVRTLPALGLPETIRAEVERHLRGI